MRDFGSPINDHLTSLEGVVPRHLVWVEAKNRVTGATETQGFWNGGVDRDFTVEGVTQTYAASGALLNVGSIKGEVGLKVQYYDIVLSGIPTEVQEAINLYDLRLAPIKIHTVFFDPVKNVVIGDPQRILKGTVDEVRDSTPKPGGNRNVTLKIADATRDLTRTLTAKKSDADQRRVSATDRGREYATVSGAVPVWWGNKRERGAPPATPATAGPQLNDAQRQK